MKSIIIYFVDKYRRIKHHFYTFLLKRQLVSYGDHIGAAKFIKISRKAKVAIGCHCGFNGMTISGLGGGKNRKLFPLWNKHSCHAWKSRL